MAQIIQDGIQFNSVYGSPRVAASGIVKRPNEGSLPQDWYNAGSYHIVEAPDIKWCGAVLPNGDISTGGQMSIDTTGELLSLINSMQNEIYVLGAAVMALLGSND